MSITEELIAEIKKYPEQSEQFKAQHEQFKQLKEKIDNSGYVYGDKFEIPLMIRMGIAAKAFRQSWKD
jgi:hypothetical protein